MKRYQLAEFCDQSWLPPLAREAYHDCVSFVHRMFRPFYGATKRICAANATGTPHTYLDLASGSGEHIAELYRLAKSLPNTQLPKFIVSDLYPLTAQWQALQQKIGAEQLRYLSEPVSVEHVPSITRDWTIFMAFHHFPPSLAAALLKQSTEKCNSLHIAEETHRSWLNILSMPLTMPTLLFAPLFARRFSFAKLLITTVIPIVPLMIMIDGIISCLRTYTYEEMLALLPKEAHENFRIEYHEPRIPMTPFKTMIFSLYRINPLPDIASTSS